jgi:hypothetical protein
MQNSFLEVQVRLAQPVVIAEDTAFVHRTVLLADRSQQASCVIVSPKSSAVATLEGPHKRECHLD